jgi:anti-sigma-K factor RskA
MDENDHISDLLPAYALGVLDPDEIKLARAHLEECEHCRLELEAYHSVSEKLVLAVPAYHPPQGLREKIMQAVSESNSPAGSIFNWEKLKTSFQALPAVWVAMSLLVLVLAASNMFLWREVYMLRASAEDIRFITVVMQGTEAAPLASGLVIINPSGQHGTLVVDGLPYLETNYEYQLWLIRDGTRANGGTFSVNEQGYASIRIYAHDPLISYPGFGITIEPTGGSSAPTGDRVLGGEL